MDTDNIIVNDKDLQIAQRICASITDLEHRNKSVANVVAAKIASSYFDNDVYDIDVQTSLHNFAPIVEHYEISDLYVNGAYVDVRVYFSDDELCVPKAHFDNDILPVVYMFVKLSSDLKGATVTGFIYPESINKNNIDNDVYVISPNELSTFYDVEMRLNNNMPMQDVDNEVIYKLLEGSLNERETLDLLKLFIKSKYARTKFLKVVNAQFLFNFVSTPTQEAAVETIELPEQESLTEVHPVDITEDVDDDEDLSDEDLDSLFDNIDDVVSNGNESGNPQSYTTEITPSGADVIESLDNQGNEVPQENSEQIETLFTGEQQGVPVAKKKKGGLIPVLLVALLISSGVYFLTNYMSNKGADEDYITSQPPVEEVDTENSESVGEQQAAKQEDAMPVETVEQAAPAVNNEESNAVAIPAIERNLDASVLVSNLKVDWEVPEGYASNTAAKRYLVKLGKIIQLNLKTELLLLSKPPLSNKIMVELKYNTKTGKFEISGIQMSSGEKTVDDAIIQTVRNALGHSVGTNFESFAKLQGNPILIIHL